MNILSSHKLRFGVVMVVALGLAGAGLGTGHAADESASSAQPHGDALGPAINDTAITAKVRAKLNGTDRLNDANINIQTTNGVVTLTGKVEDVQAKDQASQLAQRVDGVKSVDNQLDVSTGPLQQGERVASDSWITTKVKSKLVADNAQQGVKVNVSTENGVVTLKGTLPNEHDVQHVTSLARQVDGVKEVNAAGLTASSH